MAFDYQSLRNITDPQFIRQTLVTGDFASSSVTTATIVNNTVTATQLGTGSVVMSSNVVTNTLQYSRGGTGLTSLGGGYYALAVNSSGNGYNWVPYGVYGIQVFTSSTTWTRPSYVRYIKVQLVGAGGGGSGHGESGGAGGYSERILNVTGISSVSVSVAGGDSGSSFYSGAGAQGGGTSFGPYLSASGGYGANQNNQHSGGLGGAGSGGDINVYGGGGQTHHTRSAVGGDCYFGGAVAAGHPQGGNFSHNHQGHATPGSGGTGGYFGGHYGSQGKNGIIIVTMYY